VHLAQHEIDVHHLEIDVGFAGRVGADRHQIVGAVYLYAVAGIIEQRDVCALNLPPEILDVGIEGSFVEIDLGASADQVKPRPDSVSAISVASLRGLSSRVMF